MKTADLYRWMDDPSLLSVDTLAPLAAWVEAFPYFPTVRLLYLKNLAILNDPRLEAEVEKTAVVLPDRRKLFYWLEGERYGLQPLPVADAPGANASDSFSLIDAFLSTCPGEKEGQRTGAVLFQPSVSSDYLYWSLSSAAKTEDAEKEKSDEAVAESREREDIPEENCEPAVSDAGTSPEGKGMDLIDNFLRNEEERGSTGRLSRAEKEDEQTSLPSVKAPDEGHLKSLDDSYFTETLARIYVKQKRYEKALQIIKNLSLKYPEKNVYFADQIRFLEKLIINTKK